MRNITVYSALTARILALAINDLATETEKYGQIKASTTLAGELLTNAPDVVIEQAACRVAHAGVALLDNEVFEGETALTISVNV